MSSGSAEPALDVVAGAFHAATGYSVGVTYNRDIPAPDVIVASRDAIERKLRPAGRIADEGVVVGQMGIGVGIRSGVKVPEIGSVAALSQAVLGAETVLVTLNHSTGLYVEDMLQRLHLHDRIAGRILRLENGPAVMDCLAAGQGRDLAFLSMNEFRTYAGKGVTLVGPLPAPVQYLRDFIVAPASSARDPLIAEAFVRFCAEAGAAIFAAHGFTQAADVNA